MSGKKAKLIRRLAKQKGIFKREPDYKMLETKKMEYGVDQLGKSIAQPVVRVTLINSNRIEYRKLKKAYNNGEFAI